MSTINRIVITDSSNGLNPTGFSNPADGPTLLRKISDMFGRAAQGASNSSTGLAYAPVAAQATVNTTTGSETTNDTLTVCGSVITLKSSGANTTNQANIAAGTAGTSTSGATPAITATNLTFSININGDGAQPLYIGDAGTHTGAQIASKIQTAIRALTPNNSLNAVAFSSATCTYGSTYVITSGVYGSGSSVVITGNGAATLKLGISNGGTEAVGTASTLDNMATVINKSSNAWNGICTAFVCGENMTLTAAIPGTIGNGLALAVSSTGAVMTISEAWGASVAGSEGTFLLISRGI